MSTKESKSGNKTVEDVYKKMTLLENILKRPDTYVGSLTKETQQHYILDKSNSKMELQTVNIVPALYKIVDEILVNAADQRQRKSGMTSLWVDIDTKCGRITVKNDGKAIPIQIHREHKMWVPELIFGELLASENYDDTEQRTTGGRNGYGAKLTNIYSSEFTVETHNPDDGKHYTQTWTKNMHTKLPPVITDIVISKRKKKTASQENFDQVSSKDGSNTTTGTTVVPAAKIPPTPKRTTKAAQLGWTKISFIPDWSRFGMTGFDEDIIAVVKRRVYDMAGTCSPKGLKVYYNQVKVNIKDFKSYCQLFLRGPSSLSLSCGTDKSTELVETEGGETKKQMEPVSPPPPAVIGSLCFSTGDPDTTQGRWEVGVAISPNKGFEQTSFVNAICTSSGGTHVKHVSESIVAALLEKVEKRTKIKTLRAAQIKNHLWVFVNCLIVNPRFNTQTKVQLTSLKSEFGSKWEVDTKLINAITKSEIMQQIVDAVTAKENKDLQKTDGKKTTKKNGGRLSGIEKLEDANEAGGRNSARCTLILTEGDSAKALAMAGICVVGRDRYGVFPLRGKVLNVRQAKVEAVNKNAEITALKQILGLKSGVNYTSVSQLRYGSVMIMADQDYDGSHIKGLIINLFAWFWPSLLKMPGFLTEFITPIIKVKGSRSFGERTFFSVPEYEAFRKSSEFNPTLKIKYYKGLGTSTNAEAKEYFGNLQRHRITFRYDNTEDEAAIHKAFCKKQSKSTTTMTTSAADIRKDWIASYIPGTYLDQNVSAIGYQEFVNRELILYSMESNHRNIPSIMDGLKPGNRKILYACFKRNLTQEIKVAQLAGYVSEHAAYHHGESSLAGTIINMAQNYVGSNNINLLEPAGQFGTRSENGADAASPRYIFTNLCPITRLIYRAVDDNILTYLEDDGQMVEPEYYLPVLPMVLVNGSEGMGTGWSTKIPNHNPRDIVGNLRILIARERESSFELPAEGKTVSKAHAEILGVNAGKETETKTKKLTAITDVLQPPLPLPLSLSLPLKEMHPWYKGFKGCFKKKKENNSDTDTETTITITSSSSDTDTNRDPIATTTPTKGKLPDNKYIVSSVATIIGPTTVHVSEIPLERGTTAYRTKVLEKNVEEGKIVSFTEHHRDNSVDFKIEFTPEAMDGFRQEPGLMDETLRLVSSCSISNMVMFTKQGTLRRYNSSLEILEDWFKMRLPFYLKRKQWLEVKLGAAVQKISNKVRFVLAVIADEMKIRNVAKVKIIEQLKREGYHAIDTRSKKSQSQNNSTNSTNNHNSESKSPKEDGSDRLHHHHHGYEYLLSMPLWSLTMERVDELRAELKSKVHELDVLKATQPLDMWECDLNEFEQGLKKHEDDELKVLASAVPGQLTSGDGANKKIAKSVKAKGKTTQKATAATTKSKKSVTTTGARKRKQQTTTTDVINTDETTSTTNTKKRARVVK